MSMKYTKKPMIVDAEEFWPWSVPEGVITRTLGGNPISLEGERVEWYINTPDGEIKVEPGDWIITEKNGKKYPCKPQTFKVEYEIKKPLKK